jgi:hypothetical protein
VDTAPIKGERNRVKVLKCPWAHKPYLPSLFSLSLSDTAEGMMVAGRRLLFTCAASRELLSLRGASRRGPSPACGQPTTPLPGRDRLSNNYPPPPAHGWPASSSPARTDQNEDQDLPAHTAGRRAPPHLAETHRTPHRSAPPDRQA